MIKPTSDLNHHINMAEVRTEGVEPSSIGLEPTMLPLHHVLIRLDVRVGI